MNFLLQPMTKTEVNFSSVLLGQSLQVGLGWVKYFKQQNTYFQLVLSDTTFNISASIPDISLTHAYQLDITTEAPCKSILVCLLLCSDNCQYILCMAFEHAHLF